MHLRGSEATPHRVIVQHVKEGERWLYRLVAYGDTKTYRPARFESLESLITAIQSVVPNFSSGEISLSDQPVATYIAYTGEWQLDNSRIEQLGLADRSLR